MRYRRLKLLLALPLLTGGGMLLAGCHGGPHISACGTYTSSGTDHAHPVTYIVDSSPTGSSEPCLDFDADHVVIACASKTNFSARTIWVHNSTDVIVQNCGFIHGSSPANLTFTQVDHSEAHDNAFSYPSASGSGVTQFYDDRGSYNKVYNNTFDGGASSFVVNSSGYDDGVVLGPTVSHDEVYDNTFSHYWDACVETLGAIDNTSVSTNTCSNAQFGVGGWYNNAWDSNFVNGNRFSSVKLMFQFGYTNAGGSEAHVFTNNWFNDNDVSSIVSNNQSATFSFFSNFTVSNNAFSGNDFLNTVLAPYFNPDESTAPNAYNDSGGNTCGSHSTPYPLSC